MNGHHLLINEYPLIVQPSLVMAIGLEQAIILQQIHYWLARSTNVQEGRKWVYNSYEAWQVQFPWMSAVTIKRYILGMEKEGYLISDNFNKLKIDQTKWYTIDYDQLAEVVRSQSKSDTAIVSVLDSQETDPTPSVPETTPETNSETTPDTRGAGKPAARGWEPEAFEEAWAYYGKVGGRLAAVKAWNALKPDGDLMDAMSDAIDKQRVLYGWGLPDGQFQPHFSTWLTGQRWLDEPKPRRISR